MNKGNDPNNISLPANTSHVALCVLSSIEAGDTQLLVSFVAHLKFNHLTQGPETFSVFSSQRGVLG